jgi:hypothetical protein
VSEDVPNFPSKDNHNPLSHLVGLFPAGIEVPG